MKKYLSVCFTIFIMTLLICSCSDDTNKPDYTSSTSATTTAITTTIPKTATTTTIPKTATTTKPTAATTTATAAITSKITTTAIDNSNGGPGMVNSNKLVVIGQNIPQAEQMIFNKDQGYVALPFTAIIEVLGADVEWLSETLVKISFNEEIYTLDTQQPSLLKEGNDVNCIIPAPGSRVHYHNLPNEFLIDDVTLRTVVMIMGVDLKIVVDSQQRYVDISYR